MLARPPRTSLAETKSVFNIRHDVFQQLLRDGSFVAKGVITITEETSLRASNGAYNMGGEVTIPSTDAVKALLPYILGATRIVICTPTLTKAREWRSIYQGKGYWRGGKEGTVPVLVQTGVCLMEEADHWIPSVEIVRTMNEANEVPWATSVVIVVLSLQGMLKTKGRLLVENCSAVFMDYPQLATRAMNMRIPLVKFE